MRKRKDTRPTIEQWLLHNPDVDPGDTAALMSIGYAYSTVKNWQRWWPVQ